jgi:hypothetical protein
MRNDNRQFTNGKFLVKRHCSNCRLSFVSQVVLLTFYFSCKSAVPVYIRRNKS